MNSGVVATGDGHVWQIVPGIFASNPEKVLTKYDSGQFGCRRNRLLFKGLCQSGREDPTDSLAR